MANLLEIANHGITSSRPVDSPAVTDGRERIGRGDKRARQLHPDETRSNDNDLLYWPTIP